MCWAPCLCSHSRSITHEEGRYEIPCTNVAASCERGAGAYLPLLHPALSLADGDGCCWSLRLMDCRNWVSRNGRLADTMKMAHGHREQWVWRPFGTLVRVEAGVTPSQALCAFCAFALLTDQLTDSLNPCDPRWLDFISCPLGPLTCSSTGSTGSTMHKRVIYFTELRYRTTARGHTIGPECLEVECISGRVLATEPLIWGRRADSWGVFEGNDIEVRTAPSEGSKKKMNRRLSYASQILRQRDDA